MLQQLRPRYGAGTPQLRIRRHDRHEAIDEQRLEGQRIGRFGFESEPELDASALDRIHYLLLNDVLHGHFDVRMLLSILPQHAGQNVARERRHRRNRDVTALERESLMHALPHVVPISKELQRLRKQSRTFRCEPHLSCRTREQSPAERLLQTSDREAQGRLRKMQSLAGSGEAERLRHYGKGLQLSWGH